MTDTKKRDGSDSLHELVVCVDDVLGEALDNVDVHPCDEDNDEIKSKGLGAEMKALYDERMKSKADND